ncbi:hypothetical protein QUA74_29140 [Microcoleus sp. LAD1_D3]|uniref:hypothetical protein n=1 Tax=Microcoleus sp. LAD1_D3 TaxID=2819365 RepID=UPI002FCF7CFB
MPLPRSSAPKARVHCNHDCASALIICNAPGFTAVRYAAARVETSSRSDAKLILVWLLGRAQETQRAYRGDVANFTAFISRQREWETLRQMVFRL